MKSTKKLYENEVLKMRAAICRPRYLLPSFSSVLELTFTDTIRKWRASAVLTSVLFEGKSGEKDAEQNEEELVVHAFRSCGVTSTKASTQKIVSRLLTKTRK